MMWIKICIFTFTYHIVYIKPLPGGGTESGGTGFTYHIVYIKPQLNI